MREAQEPFTPAQSTAAAPGPASRRQSRAPRPTVQIKTAAIAAAVRRTPTQQPQPSAPGHEPQAPPRSPARLFAAPGGHLGGGAATARRAGVLAADLEAPEVADTTVDAHLLEALHRVTHVTVDGARGELGELTSLVLELRGRAEAAAVARGRRGQAAARQSGTTARNSRCCTSDDGIRANGAKK